MQRIERALQAIENRLVYLASNEELPANVREPLLSVLSSHLETINKWKVATARIATSAANSSPNTSAGRTA